MFRRMIGMLGILFLIAQPTSAMELGKVTLPDSFKIESADLVLNGAGFRKKWFVKVYAGGLYLSEKRQDPKQIIEADEPMALRLHMVYSGITSKKMTDAMTEGFAKATGGNIEPIKEEIEMFNSFFQEEIKEQDIFDIAYTPGDGLRVYKNTTLKGTISGFDFKQAVFGIWLCDKPADKNLKKKMLGK
jgi:Chalcone isomerase-like